MIPNPLDLLRSQRDLARLAIVTFAEGFLAAWAVADKPWSSEALVGAGAAGASLVYNLCRRRFRG